MYSKVKTKNEHKTSYENSFTKRQLSFIPYSKVIGFTNYKLKISNYQLKVHKFFW